jgi:hypothetical protein
VLIAGVMVGAAVGVRFSREEDEQSQENGAVFGVLCFDP